MSIQWDPATKAAAERQAAGWMMSDDAAPRLLGTETPEWSEVTPDRTTPAGGWRIGEREQRETLALLREIRDLLRELLSRTPM